MDKDELEEELRYFMQEERKYSDLLFTLIWASKPKLTDGRLWMQFDCTKIKEWLYKHEPEMMERWEIEQQKKVEGWNEQR